MIVITKDDSESTSRQSQVDSASPGRFSYLQKTVYYVVAQAKNQPLMVKLGFVKWRVPPYSAVDPVMGRPLVVNLSVSSIWFSCYNKITEDYVVCCYAYVSLILYSALYPTGLQSPKIITTRWGHGL